VDKYDRNVKALAENPGGLPRAWFEPDLNPLFEVIDLPGVHACLTMIRNVPVEQSGHVRVSELRPEVLDLLREINQDSRLPTSLELTQPPGEGGWPDDRKVASLPVFAEYQRRIDALRKSEAK
jgi:hypothetical protein